ncbi:hypothetical protein AFE_2101 [Acidithiobacillus ferrooxidans ATCC 23270]|uniref:Uncharacterized protein n=1 Tax=Acidithiobacillus ferrooxidans (strain ATCC 23270 / DSM 14882 / CIP 104768 / NCIMB 8455) TaxID=243159 RepID=B7J4W1_ACIF2|nr:hypothetical protein AFE_2101 [Acidithiobacillus ferrooxidans ATCC 23270]
MSSKKGNTKQSGKTVLIRRKSKAITKPINDNMVYFANVVNMFLLYKVILIGTLISLTFIYDYILINNIKLLAYTRNKIIK